MTSALLALSALVLVPPQEPKKGRFQATFTDPHPLSTVDEYKKRTGWKIGSLKGYALSEEAFEVYVPDAYTPGTPFGLFVYINSGDSGAPPKEWLPVLDQYALIWAGANNAGNKRSVWYRSWLAMDAVHNMTRRYTVDPDRIYLSGESGGGRSASMTALMFPEVFSGGGYFLIGCDYFRDLDVVGGGGNYMPASVAVPAKPLLELARTRNRYAIFTGSNDHLRVPCLTAYRNGFLKDKFRYIEYFEKQGWGHKKPDAEWFEKGIASLDAPLIDAAAAHYAAARKLERSKKLKEAYLAYAKAGLHGRGEDFQEAARAKAAELRPEADRASEEGFAKLAKRSRPDVRKLREYAVEWAGFPGGEKAKEKADGLAREALERLGKRRGSSLRRALQEFLAEWRGYPVWKDALAALDRAAGPELARIEKVSSERARHARLRKFALDWAPSTPAAKAKAAVREALDAKVEAVQEEKDVRKKAALLAELARYYPGTPQGDWAARALKELLKKK